MASIFKRQGKGPWIVQYFDHQGRRRERSSRTTDRKAAGRIAAKLEADVALRRDGVVDPSRDLHAQADAQPLSAHVADYLRHLRLGDRSPRTIGDAEAHLEWAVEATGAARLSDLTLDRVTRALDGLRALGRSARTINHRGGSVRAFLRFAVRTGRLPANPLEHLPKLDERRDRRRVRRELSDAELERLFAVADERGRGLWYRLAFWAGLRLSELRRMTWSWIDLDRKVIVVRHGKAHRTDEVPIHPVLLEALRAAVPGLPGAKVFATVPTNATRQKDYERAGIALEDDRARVADLHALRSSLATRLAREGVPLPITRRILRHARAETTAQYYVRLELADDAAALSRIRAPSSTPSSQGADEGDSVRDGATDDRAVEGA